MLGGFGFMLFLVFLFPALGMRVRDHLHVLPVCLVWLLCLVGCGGVG